MTQVLLFSGVTTFNSLSADFKSMLMPRSASGPHITVSRATRRDCDQIFELVNLAFKPEIGKTGIAYRKCDKYRLKDSARKHLEDMWVIKDNRKVRNLLSFYLLTLKFYSPHHTIQHVINALKLQYTTFCSKCIKLSCTAINI